jgi:tetratricopeptide (TPR) repeat protein
MPSTPPQVDEHGFPIPPTFDDPNGAGKRRGSPRKLVLWGLFLVFVALLAGGMAESGGWKEAKDWMAGVLVNRAREKVALGDLPGALTDLQRASAWSPDNPNIFKLRADIKQELNDFAGSLEDYDRVIKLNGRHAAAYNGRSRVYQRLNRHREAIDDLTQVVKLSSERDPMSRNNRAYARAIGGLELEEGFQDIEAALALSADLRGEANDAEHALAALLDTRGYLHFLLGRPEPALADLDQAIKNAKKEHESSLDIIEKRYGTKARRYYQTEFNKELAVIYHHRGQIHEALGHSPEAQDDLKRGDELGYNPAEGVY